MGPGSAGELSPAPGGSRYLIWMQPESQDVGTLIRSRRGSLSPVNCRDTQAASTVCTSAWAVE